MTGVDVVIIADGGQSPAAARQLSRLLEAHRQASIRTGLLMLRADRTNPGWLGSKEIFSRFDDDTFVRLDPDVLCSAPLTLVLAPRLAFIEPATPLRLNTEQAIIWPAEPVIELPGEQRSLAARAPDLARNIAQRLKAPVLFAARTAGERHDLMQHAIGLRLTDWIWWPLLDESQESRAREGGRKPRVGRHWQSDAPLDAQAYGTFAAAFGDCWPMDLVFHGKRAVLESLPPFDQRQGMELRDQDQQPLDAFLSALSLFVAVGDDRGSAHVPLAMFEAMQADVVVIAPPVISAIIDSPLPVAAPAGLMGLASSLLSDNIAFERARRQQRQLMTERHSAKAHQARIGPYLTPKRSVAPAPANSMRGADRILFVSDDSPHLEHLTRALAIAEHLPASLRPFFVTTARNARLAEQRGHPVEYVQAHNSLPFRQIFDDARRWNFWFERHLAELISFTGARALVFDGVYPFGGVIANRRDFLNLPFVWIRQALWRPKASQDALRHSREFDLVIEPGDLAAAFDRGPLQPLRRQVLATDPVRLDAPVPRAEARRSLGLADDDGPAFLIDPTLPIEKIEGETVSLLLDSLEQSGGSLWTIDPLGATSAPWSRQVRRLGDPEAGRLRAGFDGAISAADYRSVHDQVAAGLPSVLLPGFGSSTDDQAARADFAEGAGFAIALRLGDVYGARAAARKLLDSTSRTMMTAALAGHETENGAEKAALAITNLVYSVGMPALADAQRV